MNTSENFQSRSSRTGRSFEVWTQENLAQFGALVGTGVWKGNKLVEVDVEFETAYVFAKGGEAKRPGLYRTDNTKKCMADVCMLRALMDLGEIERKLVIVTTTAMPPKGEGYARSSQAWFLRELVDDIIVRPEKT